MNKFALLSGICTLLLVFFQYIPIGLYFAEGGEISIWMFKVFNITENPILNHYVQLPLNLFHIGDAKIYLFGIVSSDYSLLWLDIHMLTFIILFVFSLLGGILSLIGCAKESKTGKKLVNANFYLILTVLIYSLLGISIYSQDILNESLQIIELFYYLGFGFYFLLFTLIISIIAKYKHPI